MVRRRKAGGSAARPGRPTIRWWERFLAGSPEDPNEAPGSTLEVFFPGISWAEDLEWSKRRNR